jgi:2-polyprenyl-6-hydroxyphenyl methylase/3-demethylubiquinone-9 3-methyltransferase
MLQWIATARARLVPRAARPRALLVDVGCGGGLFAPHAAALGYRHVGVDITRSALAVASRHGVAPVRGDAAFLPLADGVADVVCAGEILEHVPDPRAVVAEACRVLRPGGRIVLDTIAATALARFLAVSVAERIPGGAPPGIHDPRLFIDRRALRAACGEHGVRLDLTGLRPTLSGLLAWRFGRRGAANLVPTRSTAVLFQAVGVKRS